MRKILLFTIIFEIMVAGHGLAGDFEAGLTVGDTSLYGGLNYKSQMAMDGFWRTGFAGLYADKDSMEYKWLELDFSVGNETMLPGLVFEVGFKGLLGEAELKPLSGDVGALAFNGRVAYLFYKNITPIPIEIFAGLGYAPQILSFGDNKNFFSYKVGLGFHIVENASIIAEYVAYDLDMESGPGDWTLYDNLFRFGLTMRF